MVKCKKQDTVSFLAWQLRSRQELCTPWKRIILLASPVIYRRCQFRVAISSFFSLVLFFSPIERCTLVNPEGLVNFACDLKTAKIPTRKNQVINQAGTLLGGMGCARSSRKVKVVRGQGNETSRSQRASADGPFCKRSGVGVFWTSRGCPDVAAGPVFSGVVSVAVPLDFPFPPSLSSRPRHPLSCLVAEM